MQEITTAFADCFNEIENNQGDVCFEINSDQFSNERDYEEIKILFNLARLSIEMPSQKVAETKILTSDLRKISNEELEKVLMATEKAIDIPVITLRALKEETSSRISKILLNSKDEKDSQSLFTAHARKSKAASSAQRSTSLAVDLVVSVFAACLLSFILINSRFPGLADNFSRGNFNLSAEHLPLLALLAVLFLFACLFYPMLSMQVLGCTAGTKLSGIKLKSDNNRKAGSGQVFIRYSTMPLSLLSFSFLNVFNGKQALHDTLSKTHFTS